MYVENKRLNPAGVIAQAFVTSKLTVLFMLSCVLLGVMAILLTPREENPQIIVPGAEIFVSMPGATPEEIEELVINPLEGIIREISGVDHTYAVALNSVGVVTVQFEVGLDKERSLLKLYDRVLGKQDQLPADASVPLIKSIEVDDVPIMAITLASEKYDDYALKRLADNMVDRLRSLNEVSVAFVKGGRDREVRVELDPERLLGFGITLDQMRAALQMGNLSAPVGAQTHQGKVSSIYLDGFLTSADQVKKLIVGSFNQQAIYIEDVAEIIDGPRLERDKLSRFGYGPADPRFGSTSSFEIPSVTIAVAKKAGSNAVVVAGDILDRVERMKQSFIPAGVDVVITRNDGKKADAAVNNLIEHMGIAIFSVFIVIVLFLGFKEALIVGITVPFILALTLGADYFFGPTINRVTLFALILSLGLLVDSAIVVIENIHRHYKNLWLKDKVEVTVIATNEIGNPTNLATFAIMLVFGSLMVITDMSGQYFYPIAFNVPIAMLTSLLVAYIVTPWAANRWLQPEEGEDLESHNAEDKLHTFYYKIITPLLDIRRYRYISIACILVAIMLSMLQPAWQFIRSQGVGGPLSAGGVALVMLPKDNKNTFNITIDMPEYTPVEITDQATREVGAVLRNNPHVLNYQSWVGQTGVIDFNGLLKGASNKKGAFVGEVRVNLTDKKVREVSSIDLVRELRPVMEGIQQHYPGSVIQLVEDLPGPPLRSTVLAEIYGKDPAKLREISAKVSEVFKSTHGVVEVHDSEVADVPQFRVVVDKEKAALSGVSVAQVVQSLRRMVNGDVMGRLHISAEKKIVPIRLHIPYKYQVDPLLLSSIYLTNREGKRVPLSELTKVVKDTQDRPILHKDFERVTYVGGELTGTTPVYAVMAIDERLDNMSIGGGEKLTTGNLRLQSITPDTIDGYQLLWDGEIRLTLDIFRDMLGALGIALVFIYLLLVGYYASFKVSLIAMSAIPLALIGVFPGHWLVGEPFTSTSMIGVIALAGVVVRNSLLIIDFIQDYMKEGMSAHEAVREAGAVRLRPILLTALAIVLGSAVMLSDPVFGGLAIALIFGTISSTALTLIVIPMLMYSMLRRQALNSSTTGE
ncbi:MAG: efflux RND transporter permease subunit [Cycloclasticus sp.]|jgi:multidrug efflux pump subunit AcrB